MKLRILTLSNLTRYVIGFVTILVAFYLASDNKNLLSDMKIDERVPFTYQNGCHLQADESDLKTCLGGLSKQNEENLLYLVGDSHAAQWAPALQITSKSSKVKVRYITKSGCPYVHLELNLSCELWIDEVTREIVRESPSLVILSNMTNAKYFNFLNEDHYVKTWLTSFDLLMKKIASHTRIVILEDTPYSFFDSKICIVESGVSKCDLKLRESNLTQKLKVYSESIGVDYLSFKQVLCKNNLCKGGDYKMNYYRDRHHLSVSFSQKFSIRFNDYIKSLTSL